MLKEIIQSEKLSLMMEAHNGMSALVAEQAGFNSIWASGFSIASSLGLRDCNEASWSQVLDIVEYMGDASSLPILLDGDSGFGNSNNVKHIVKKASLLGVQGIALEDKPYPKLNSFHEGLQLLVPVEEHCARIQAAKNGAVNDDFVVVARTEALITGNGMDEAISRSELYHQSGADAIFIHSKSNTPDEIMEFGRRWDKRCPLIVAPTTYPQVDFKDLEQLGISVVICANHLMRAAMGAMKKTASDIFKAQSVNVNLPPVSEVFDLIDYSDLR